MISHYTVPDAAAGQRLDLFLASVSGHSRSQLKAQFAAGHVTVNDHMASASYKVRPDDAIALANNVESRPTNIIIPELPIMYQDEAVIVVDKPAGLTVHPGAGTAAGEATLADFARTVTSDDDVERPGIVHRLDKDTSGLLMIARTTQAKQQLQAALANHEIHKTYLALVDGRLEPPAATIDLPIGRNPQRPLQQAVVAHGRPAQTRYEVQAGYPGHTLVYAWPVTGRTHQLRVHFAALGHPITGDTTYGAKQRPAGLPRQFLHASRLQFTSPTGVPVDVASPLPMDLTNYLSSLAKLV